ncbi:MAG TPA: triose-phosphate isomerase [Chloroflexota bacterium]|nr:triose-phosphate isomerase [Chloroflexota bacterium]
MRRRLIVGNWKMNTTLSEARQLAQGLIQEVPPAGAAAVVVCPPFTALQVVAGVLPGSRVELGAQNMYFQPGGAYTGEIAPFMLTDLGCRYVILGHSERRRQMGETSELVNQKAHLALSSDLIPIVCVGETLPERESGAMQAVVQEQVRVSLADLVEAQLRSLVLAYEPVWAIGTGHVASPTQAQEVHQLIRAALPPAVAEEVPILYGGSVSPENVAALLSMPGIDGALVGGASLKATAFAAIVHAAG